MPTSRAQGAFTAKRRADAIQLRMAGAKWEDIAKQLGYSGKNSAHTDVMRALLSAQASVRASAEALREQEVQRLDRLQQTFWRGAVTGDLAQADRVLRIIDRRIRLLGLDVQQDLPEEVRHALVMRVAEQMYVAFAQVLDGLGLTTEQRELVPVLLQQVISPFAGVAPPKAIEGEVVGDVAA